MGVDEGRGEGKLTLSAAGPTLCLVDAEPQEIVGDHALLVSLATREFHETFGEVRAWLSCTWVEPDLMSPVWTVAPLRRAFLRLASIDDGCRQFMKDHRGEYLSLELWEDDPDGRRRWFFPKMLGESGELYEDRDTPDSRVYSWERVA